MFYTVDFKAENMTTDIELLTLDLMRAKTFKYVDNKAIYIFQLIYKDYMKNIFISFSILYINSSLEVFISLSYIFLEFFSIIMLQTLDWISWRFK